MGPVKHDIVPGAALLWLLLLCIIKTTASQTFAIINTSVPVISYVMEPFEDIDEEAWFLEVEGSVDPDVSLSISEDFLFGNGSLLVEFQYELSPPTTTSTSTTNEPPPPALANRAGNGTLIVVVDETTEVPIRSPNINTTVDPLARLAFGWIQDLKPHNCYGATHMSLWYKVQSQSPHDGMYLRLTLLDDSQCTSPTGGLCNHVNHTGVYGEYLQAYSFAVPLMPSPLSQQKQQDSGDWKELLIPVEDLVSDNRTNGNPLHLNRLRGWQITLEVRNTETDVETPDKDTGNKNGTSTSAISMKAIGTNRVNGTGSIILQLDQLACIGGGDMLGAAFHLGDDISWEEAVDEGIWLEQYYNSELAYNNSNVVLQDGVFNIDYMVQMVEDWGGFDGFTYLAPGPAYYNLTGATDWHLGFRTREEANPPWRTHLRIVIADGSHCVGNCSTDFFESERWYSFHYILDDAVTNDGWGEIYLPLNGSLDPATPLWLTGWSGQMGNSHFDFAQIKGYTLEINVDSQGDMNSTVTGAFDLFEMSALTVVYNESLELGLIDRDLCVAEPDLYFMENSPLFQIKEFLGNKCCEVCDKDETCLYALSTGRDCFIAAYIEADMVGLLSNEIMQSDLTAFWMNDAAKRGDFCDLCDCRESDRTIDCRGRDLLIVPKTFYQDAEDIGWTPRVLDLRNNSKLVLLGAGSLDSIGADLEELYLPKNMRHISMDSLDLPKLVLLQGDENFKGNLSNAIIASDDAYSDVCCSRGPSISALGVTFCDMKVAQPGIDSVYIDFLFYPGATLFKHLLPSSNFLSEAAENEQKCAEYCTISNECQYFSFDQRLPNAEHACYLLEDIGSGGEFASRQPDNFADDAQTIPGYISGYPPRTRNEIDNSRVLINQRSLFLNPTNQYEAHFEVSLGSSPLRGAVWVYPKVASETELQVSFSPSRVVLYDANTTALVTVSVAGVVAGARSVSLVVNNEVYSCDVAYMQNTGANSDTTLFIDVEMPETEEDSNLALVIGVSVALFCGLVLMIFFYFEQKRKHNDSVWKVAPEELIFSDPPEVLGRGTFGLVLKATYRGTDVAVKRVIPPKDKIPNGRNSSVASSVMKDDMDGLASGNLTRLGSVNETGSLKTGTRSRSQQRWSLFTSSDQYEKLKRDFVQEMRDLSKLRHPCITTVMGAVISSKTEPMLVMELMDYGSLYDLLHNETMIIEGELLLPILRDICQGVRFLHAAVPQIIHGDLKAQNILVDQKFKAKVADFGLSQKKNSRAGATGTPFWMAPELLRRESSNTPASDIYAFGIILYEVYSRKIPYEGEDVGEVLSLVADKSVRKRPLVPPHMPTPIRSMMADCLVEDPGDRPSFEELDHRLKRVDAKSVEPTELVRSSNRRANISLFDIFPRHIAEAMRDGKTVEAEHRDLVTIFFSDIVGFTTISSTLDPRKVANLLDRLYQQFDRLSDAHDLYKVETIGDAYMCCANLVKDQADDHVKRIADFAVAAIEAAATVRIDEDDPNSNTVEIRVGFHTGPVVADVVGSRNPRYCLFGDTVNVASRMESTSKVGHIHCSKVSADLLMVQDPTMPLTSRGEINIKGKGFMETFWVNKTGVRHSIKLDLLPAESLCIANNSFSAILEEESKELELELAETGRLLPSKPECAKEQTMSNGDSMETSPFFLGEEADTLGRRSSNVINC